MPTLKLTVFSLFVENVLLEYFMPSYLVFGPTFLIGYKLMVDDINFQPTDL